MREIRSSGSVEGVMSNHDPYSDRERSSEPLGPSFALGTERCTAKRKQGTGGLGIELQKDAIGAPTRLTWWKATWRGGYRAKCAHRDCLRWL